MWLAVPSHLKHACVPSCVGLCQAMELCSCGFRIHVYCVSMSVVADQLSMRRWWQWLSKTCRPERFSQIGCCFFFCPVILIFGRKKKIFSKSIFKWPAVEKELNMPAVAHTCNKNCWLNAAIEEEKNGK